jgi:protein-disulfide isomerase
MTAARKPTPVRKPARSNSGRFYVALGLVGAAGIAAIAWLANKPKPAARAVNAGAVPSKAEPWVMGSPTAKVTIAEFADFECPACGDFANVTEPDVRTRLVETGQARLEFYPLPLEIHKNTWDATLAAACAGDQGKFWEMHDRLFQGQFDWNGQATSNPRKVMRKYADELKLDGAKYDQCMESETHRPRIQASYNYASQLGVQSTPTFLIGGKLYPGALPYDQIKRLVDEAAKVAPATAPGTGTATDAPASVPVRAGTATPAR